MCGINFILANTYKEAYKEETYVEFEEGIHSYLLSKEKDSNNEFGLLLIFIFMVKQYCIETRLMN